MPLPVVTVICSIGIIALFFNKMKIAKTFLGSGIVLLLAISLPFLPNHLLGKLESKYRQFDLSIPVSHIVVLGASHTNDGTLPISSRLSSASLRRTNEAARIYRHNAGSQIFLSGGAVYNDQSTAVVNESLLLSIGIPAFGVTVADSKAKDTQQEAKHLRPLLINKQFALVTSASHMQRAMIYFERQGLHPIAAPADHKVKSPAKRYWWKLTPASENIHKMHTWWYEMLGIGWQKIIQ